MCAACRCMVGRDCVNCLVALIGVVRLEHSFLIKLGLGLYRELHYGKHGSWSISQCWRNAVSAN